MNTKAEKDFFVHSSSDICTKKNHYKEIIGFGGIWLSAFIVLGILAASVLYILMEGYKGLSFDYLFTRDFLSPLAGTFYLILCSILIASPIGIGAAIYLNEYANASSGLVKLTRFTIESLVGIPSIIYGLFGLAFFAIFLGMRQSILAGSLTVSIMILPIIIRTTEEALKSVPQSYRDASFALGGNKAQTIFQIVLPAAFSGILTGVMLSVGRAIAESAILILVAGGNIISFPSLFSDKYPYLLPDSGRTLAAHLYFQATSYDDLSGAFTTAVLLIAIIAFLNIGSFALQKKNAR